MPYPRTLTRVACLLLIAAFFAMPTPAVADEPPARILFVTQSAGFAHSTVKRKPHELSHTERVMKELAVTSGEFRVDCTQDVATDFTREALANYDIVMFYTTGDLPIPPETLDWFLNDWLKQPGHGFLGVHPATDTYMTHPGFTEMIGGVFDGHPWTAGGTVTIKVHEPDHPAARAWGGDRIVIKDEIYKHKNWRPQDVRVLMSLDMQQTALKRPYHVPVMWVREWGKGRVMYFSLGHREDVWTNPKYQQSLVGGVRWILGREEGAAAPNPELSAEEHAIAKAAAEGAE